MAALEHRPATAPSVAAALAGPVRLAAVGAVRGARPGHLRPDVAIVECGERRHEVRARTHPDPRAERPQRFEVDGSTVELRYAWDGLTLWLQTPDADHAFACRRREPARLSQASGAAARDVRAAINGRVAEVVAAAGTAVAIGDRLVVLEAMKMEHEVRATRAGRVAEVDVRVGDQVAPGRCLLRYEGEA